MADSSLMGVVQQTGITNIFGGFGAIGSYWQYIVVAIVTIIGITIGLTYFLNVLNYSKTFKLFEKIKGKVYQTGFEKAKFERVGIAGDYWARTQKSKKVLPKPRITSGKNTYNYYIREDGEWINFGLEDIDEKMHEAKVYYVDEDIRLQRLGIQKNLETRFKKEKFWDKYGNVIMMIIFAVIITICLVVLFQKLILVSDGLKQTASAMTKLADAMLQTSTRIGGGLTPA
jgi:uncharacterized membrane protein